MTTTFAVFPHYTDGRVAPALGGGTTLLEAEMTVCNLMYDMCRKGTRDELKSAVVKSEEGLVMALYPGDPETEVCGGGFEIRGQLQDHPADPAVLISEHHLLSCAQAALASMERYARSWNDYSRVYACAAVRRSRELDGFDPHHAAAWNRWFRRGGYSERARYLIICKPARGKEYRTFAYQSFEDAQRKFQLYRCNPLSTLTIMSELPRSIVMMSVDGAVIDRFDVGMEWLRQY